MGHRTDGRILRPKNELHSWSSRGGRVEDLRQWRWPNLRPLSGRPILTPMSDRLTFTVEELHSLIFRLDIAETVESLDELAEIAG
jgi:hypothetical protein